MRYFRSDAWYADAQDAKDAFKVIHDETVLVSNASAIRFVEAEADTGSKYVVVVTPLGPFGQLWSGGEVLVTVMAPWTDGWALQTWKDTLHDSYVAEHLCADRLRDDRLNGGDLMALTLTVAHALGREAVAD